MSDINFGQEPGIIMPPSWDSTCTNDFLNLLADDITGSCMIPMNIPKKEVYNIVQRAKKWFYKNYEYSVKESFYILPVALFKTEYFNSTFTNYKPYNVDKQRLMWYESQVPAMSPDDRDLINIYSSRNSSGDKFNLKKNFN